MRALTVVPQQRDSVAVVELPDPDPAQGDVLAEGLVVGVCGTDREILDGAFGEAPDGSERLILGHESLGRVLEAPADSGLAAGDLVVGIVREPDPEPCGACGHGEWDMCRNGRYTEHGIKGLHGFGAQRWRVPASHAVRLDEQLADVGVLVEPTTVVAKAWEQAERIGERAWFEPRTALVTGAGPIGLLAALLGVQRGLEVHVFDRNATGVKPALVEALGATYHSDDVVEVAHRVRPDIAIEATGAVPVVRGLLSRSVPYGILVLTGVTGATPEEVFDLGTGNRELVLDNGVVVGSVNANRRHYDAAVAALTAADRTWLRRIITRQVPLEDFAAAFEPQEDDVKVVLTLT